MTPAGVAGRIISYFAEENARARRDSVRLLASGCMRRIMAAERALIAVANQDEDDLKRS